MSDHGRMHSTGSEVAAPVAPDPAQASDADTDTDGVNDSAEIAAGTDPLTP